MISSNIKSTSANTNNKSTAMLSPEAKDILTKAMKYSEEACMSPVHLIVEDANENGIVDWFEKKK